MTLIVRLVSVSLLIVPLVISIMGNMCFWKIIFVCRNVQMAGMESLVILPVWHVMEDVEPAMDLH